MNKRQRRELETRLRDVMDPPADLTPEEIAGIRARAYQAYRGEAEEPSRKKNRKKSGLLRAAAAVAAAALGLTVLSVAYTVLAPATVGNADGFVRRVAFWVNDQLHLGISFPVPQDESGSVTVKDRQRFSTLTEAREALDIPLVGIREMNGLVLDEIDVTQQEESFYISVHYMLEDQHITITIEPALEANIISILSDNADTMETAIGKICIFENEAGRHGLSINDGYFVDIYGKVSIQQFNEILGLLYLVD